MGVFFVSSLKNPAMRTSPNASPMTRMKEVKRSRRDGRCQDGGEKKNRNRGASDSDRDGAAGEGGEST